MFRTLLILVALATCTTADAQLWTEMGDAPSLPPGQITLGVGPLTQIDGMIDNADLDPDIYCIQITDAASFSATTAGSVVGNLSLWLFDSNFDGVTHDGADDLSNGPNAGYQASLSSAFVQSPGVYYLGITRGGIDALNGVNEIWLDIPTIEIPPNGPGAPGPIDGWTFPGYGLDGQYSILLTGARYHGVPEPTGLALSLGSAMLGLFWRRRKLSSAASPRSPRPAHRLCCGGGLR